jgi:hypothetical protein
MLQLADLSHVHQPAGITVPTAANLIFAALFPLPAEHRDFLEIGTIVSPAVGITLRIVRFSHIV